jgi:hypothetical protein
MSGTRFSLTALHLLTCGHLPVVLSLKLSISYSYSSLLATMRLRVVVGVTGGIVVLYIMVHGSLRILNMSIRALPHVDYPTEIRVVSSLFPPKVTAPRGFIRDTRPFLRNGVDETPPKVRR